MWDAARHISPYDYGTLSSQCGFACVRAAVGLCPLFHQWRDGSCLCDLIAYPDGGFGEEKKDGGDPCYTRVESTRQGC
jgi:hypothetical protein